MGPQHNHFRTKTYGVLENSVRGDPLHHQRSRSNASLQSFVPPRFELPVLVAQLLALSISHTLRAHVIAHEIRLWRCYMQKSHAGAHRFSQAAARVENGLAAF